MPNTPIPVKRSHLVFALGLAAFAIGLRWLLVFTTGIDAGFTFAVLAVAGAAATCGRRYAFVALALLAVSHYFLVLSGPTFLSFKDGEARSVLGRFLFVGAGVILLISHMRRVEWRRARTELLLNQTREQANELRSMLDGAVDAVADPLGVFEPIRDAAGRVEDFKVLYINASGAASNDASGLTREQQVGGRLLSIAPPLRENGLFEGFVRVVETGEPLLHEVNGRDIRGVMRTYEVHAKRAESVVVVQWRDLSDVRNQMAQLRIAELRSRSLVRATSAIAWQTPIAGQFVEPQPDWMNFTGQDEEQHLRAGWLEAIHPEDRASLLQAWSDASEKAVEWSREVRVRAANGDYRHTVMTGVPLELTSSGERTREWVGVNADITDRKRVESAASDRERHLRNVLNNLFAFVGVLTPEGVLTGANQAPLAAAGIRAEDVIGKPFWDCYWWDYAEPVRERLRDSVARAAAGEIVRYDVDVRMAGGRMMRIDFMIAPMRDDFGRITHLIPSGVDVSERVRAQEQLAERERQFRTITEALPLGVWTATRDGKLDFVSGQLVQLTGVAMDQLLGEGWASVLHPDDKADASRLWTKSIATGEPYTAQFRMRTADGSYRFQQARALLSERNETSEPKWYGVTIDVDEQKKVEAELQAVYETGLLGIVRFDIDGPIIDVNEAFANMLGYTRTELLQKHPSWMSLTPDGELERDAPVVDEFRRTGHAKPFEKNYLHKEGRSIPVLVTASSPEPVVSSRGVAFVVDMTTRKMAEAELRQFAETLEQRVQERTEQLQERSAQLRRLILDLADTETRERKRLAQILHDHFQQLVSAAKLKVGIVRRKVNDANSIESFKQIEQLLDEAINESRTLATELSPPVLHDAGLQAGFEWLARKMERDHGLEVDVEVQEGSEPEAESVRLVLFECVREMLFNVVKHAGVKKARVEMRTRMNDLLSITVSDHGQGFKPGADLTRQNHEGSFGLFSIRERLSMLGGLLDIRSTPGQGTSIEITIPVAMQHVEDKARVEPPIEARPLVNGDVPTVRVLVADDHKLFREGLIALVKQEPYVTIVGEAGDGVEAVEMARNTQPDILICDISMPRMNGIQVTSVLRREMPTVKVIGLSMHERDDMAKAMRDAGAVAYCTKGGATDALLNVLKAVASDTHGASGET
jgi:PAS domain S-box-containing protein